MDTRSFPGGPSQAVVVPSLALRDLNTAARISDELIMQELAVASGDLRAYSNSSTVTAQTIPNMTVNVKPFNVFGGTPRKHALGFNANQTPQSGVAVTGDGELSTATITIAAASGTNPRRDLICFQIEEIQLNLASNTKTTISLAAVNPSNGSALTPAQLYPNTIQRVSLQYVQGTPSATPALPSLPGGWIPLAEVYVNTSATSIASTDIFYAVPIDNRGYSLVSTGAFRRQGDCQAIARGLVLNYKGGNFTINNTLYSVADGTLTVTNGTNYVFVNSSGVVTSNTSGFSDPSIPLCVVVASSGVITSVTDKRSWLVTKTSASGGGGGTSVFPKDYRSGFKAPEWVSASSVKIPAGSKFANSDGTFSIEFAIADGDQTAAFGTTGANALDTGTEATSTWYRLYAIGDSSGVNKPKALISVSQTSPTLPAGYDKFAFTGIVFRNNASGDITPFEVLHWPSRPFIKYRDIVFSDGTGTGPTQVLDNGNATSWADINLSSWVPPESTHACLKYSGSRSTSVFYYMRRKGDSSNGLEMATRAACDTFQLVQFWIETDTSQTIQYQTTDATASIDVSVMGFEVNKPGV